MAFITDKFSRILQNWKDNNYSLNVRVEETKNKTDNGQAWKKPQQKKNKLI